METTLGLILLVVVLLGVAFYASRLLIRRGMRQVIRQFRAQGATTPKGAMTAVEMGLVRGSFTDRMFRVRDYRPMALDLLRQADVIKMTGEGRLYLSEEALAQSPVKKFAGIE
jgi:hypothetical protein